MEGITRRIDELGRVVVPKEIRSALRLNEGSMLEFCVEGEGLYLKKYSPMSTAQEIALSVCNALAQYFETTALVESQDNVFCAGKKTESDYDFSAVDLNLRYQREEMVIVDAESKKCLITPVISGGDMLGNIILCVDQPSSNHKTVCMICANILSCYYTL